MLEPPKAVREVERKAGHRGHQPKLSKGSDVTGVLALAAGVVLILLGFAIPFVHRGEGARTRARRWVYRVAVILAGGLLVYAFVFPTSAAIIQTHKYREPIGSPPSAEHETVAFTSSEGSVSRPAPTSSSRSRPKTGTSRPSSPTARPLDPSPTTGTWTVSTRRRRST